MREPCNAVQGHPFRNVCDLRHGSATSLIELEYITHTAEESMTNPRVPSGLQYSTLTASMQSLDVVFLSRFLFEILGYINLLLALQPEPLLLEDSETEAKALEQQPSSKPSQTKQQVLQSATTHQA